MGMMLSSEPRVLLVDDNAVDRELVRRSTRGAFRLEEAICALDAMRSVSNSPPDCVLLDFHLPDIDGLELLKWMVDRDLTVVMLTAQGDETVAVRAMKAGAMDYVVKGADNGRSLYRVVHRTLDRASMERALRVQRDVIADSERKLSLLLQHLPALVWATDACLMYTSVSGTLKRTFGLSDDAFTGRHVGQVIDDEAWRSFAPGAHQDALRGTRRAVELVMKGKYVQIQVEPMVGASGMVEGTVGVAVDVTERRQLASQLLQAQKMEALGQMAGSVAHDVNNVLAAIMTFGSLLRYRLDEDPEAAQDADEILYAAERAAAIVR